MHNLAPETVVKGKEENREEGRCEGERLVD